MTAHGPARVPDAARPGPAAVIGRVGAPGIHVMSWNVRRPVPAALTRPVDRWGERAPRVRALLSSERPTVLCAQEVLAEQFGALRDGLGPGFAHVGRGRGAGGGGEACPIFFDTSRLDLLEWEQSALSDTPDRPGSVSWGNLFPRVVVAAHFEDRVTGRELMVLNTHLDPLSRRSRVRSARAIRELLAEGTLVDSWDVSDSRRTDQWGTYAAYREPRRGGTRIDWILATSQVRVTDAAINPLRHHGGWPSDHLPVQAVLRLDRVRVGTEVEEGDRAT